VVQPPLTSPSTARRTLRARTGKKLIRAGRQWAGGELNILVFAEAAPVLEAFALVSRCFRYESAGFGAGVVRMDWAGAASLLGLAGIRTTGNKGREVLKGVLMMEAGATQGFWQKDTNTETTPRAP